MAEGGKPNSNSSTVVLNDDDNIKLEVTSPSSCDKTKFSFSRTSSVGSAYQSSPSSSTQNTEDEDDSDIAEKSTISYKDRRREAHQLAEQKRRDAIKSGYDHLQEIVPMCQNSDSLGSQKLSKAAVLQKSIDYIQFLLKENKKQEDDLNVLQKEVVALQIMQANYEKIVKAHKHNVVSSKAVVSDEVKFGIFQAMMDSQFMSFDRNVSAGSFAELSGSVINWLEEHCKPHSLQELTLNILTQINQQMPNQSNSG